MNIYKVFKSKSKIFYTFLILLGIVNSVMYSGLLMLINISINRDDSFVSSEYNWLLYIVIIALSIICSKIFQTYIVKLTNEILFNFEVSVLQNLINAEFENFEKLGVERVYTAIGDTRVLGRVPENFINGFNSFIIILCGIGYMFFNSVLGGFMVLSVMVFLLVFYLKRNKKIEKDLNVLRDLQNNYYKYLNDLLNGFKEVKMSRKRNESIFSDFLKRNRVDEKKLGVNTSIKYLDNELMGSYSWYIVLGLVMYALPVITNIDMNQTSTYIITILYMIGPVGTIITLVPFYTKVKIGLERLNDYEEKVNCNLGKPINFSDLIKSEDEFESLVFNNIVYEYRNEDLEKTFTFGPVNLEIRRGEVVFIVGGNGSGKSTFVNLLTGLYKPTSGGVFLNDERVRVENYPYFSNKISAIFTNNYLFNENYEGFDLSTYNGELDRLIRKMQLDKAVEITDNSTVISKKLSKGQQKRLAMVYSLLENKEILILDEWAAEQDPTFRAFFYNHFLKELQAMGKTVIAVTHDDSYYSCADRIIKFDYGKILYDEKINAQSLEVLQF